MDELTPLGAPASPDPYPYYASLVRERPFAYDASLRSWVAAGADAVEDVLGDAALCVRPPGEPVPPILSGTRIAPLFARFVRFTDGAYHARVRQGVVDAFEAIDWGATAQTFAALAREIASGASGAGAAIDAMMFAFPAASVALLMGVPRERCESVAGPARALARAIAPGAAQGDAARAEDVVARLEEAVGAAEWLARHGASEDEAHANAVSFFFQVYDATAALIGNALVNLARQRAAGDAAGLERLVGDVARYDPPVHNTRRFAARATLVAGERVGAGDSVLVVLAAANYDRQGGRNYTFGAGPHACPGARVATSLAAAALAALFERGVDPAAIELRGYAPLTNVRLPVLAMRD